MVCRTELTVLRVVGDQMDSTIFNENDNTIHMKIAVHNRIYLVAVHLNWIACVGREGIDFYNKLGSWENQSS